jgi:uncharacterized membrane protein YphA (DoxX/SURF4 family)
MRLRDQVALTLPSLMLRLILGITFLWAGTGKLMGTFEVMGDDAARLANIGIMPTTPAPVAAPESLIDSTTIEDLDEPVNTSEDLSEQANEIIESIKEQLDEPEESSDDPATDPVPDPADEPKIDLDKVQLQTVQYSGTVHAGSDFPDPMEVKRVYSIALMLSQAADPGLTQDSTPIEPIMPAMFGSKPWPKVLAWAAAITELVAGIFLILGIFTRLSALSTFSVMLVAMWMTQIGPAVIQSNDAILGFIPRVDDPWSPGSYIALFWQLALAGMSAAVFFLGSGAIGIDRLIFKPSQRDPYIHGDPKAAKNSRASKGSQNAPAADRGEFDRTPNPTP